MVLNRAGGQGTYSGHPQRPTAAMALEPFA